MLEKIVPCGDDWKLSQNYTLWTDQEGRGRKSLALNRLRCALEVRAKKIPKMRNFPE